MRIPPPRHQIYIGMGMSKTGFAQKVAPIMEAPYWSDVYKYTYGGAWWRITDPYLISIAQTNYGKIVLYDEKEKKIIQVFE